MWERAGAFGGRAGTEPLGKQRLPRKGGLGTLAWAWTGPRLDDEFVADVRRLAAASGAGTTVTLGERCAGGLGTACCAAAWSRGLESARPARATVGP